MDDRNVIAEQTPLRQIALPHPDNDLQDDVTRLRAALGRIDTLLAELSTGLATKSNAATVTAGFSAVNEAMATLDASIGGTAGRATALEARAAALEGADAALSGRIAPVEAALPTKVGLSTTLATNTDLNTVTTSGFYRLNSPSTPNIPSSECGYAQMIVSRGADTIVQMVFQHDAVKPYVRVANRLGGSPTWQPWRRLLVQGDYGLGAYCVSLPAGTNLNDIETVNGYFMSPSFTNAPGVGWWLVHQISHATTWIDQVAYPVDGVNRVYRRRKENGTWGNWFYTEEWRDDHFNDSNAGWTLEPGVRYSMWASNPRTNYLPYWPNKGDKIVLTSPWGHHSLGAITIARSNPAHQLSGGNGSFYDAVTFDVNIPIIQIEYVWDNVWVIG